MCGKCTVVAVQLIHNYKLQFAQKAAKLAVVWQNGQMQHVWVCDDHLTSVTNIGAFLTRSDVAIQKCNVDVLQLTLTQHLPQLRELVLRKRFGREYVHYCCIISVGQTINGWQIVRQRLAARGRS